MTMTNNFFFKYGMLLPNDYKGISCLRESLLVVGSNSNVAFVLGTDKNGRFLMRRPESRASSMLFNPNRVSGMKIFPESDFSQQRKMIETDFDFRGKMLLMQAFRIFDEDKSEWMKSIGIEFDKGIVGRFQNDLIRWFNVIIWKHTMTIGEMDRVLDLSGIKYKEIDDSIMRNELVELWNGIDSHACGIGYFDMTHLVRIHAGLPNEILELQEGDKLEDAYRKLDAEEPKMPSRNSVMIDGSPIGNFLAGKKYEVLEWIERIGRRYARIVDENGTAICLSESHLK